MIKNILATAIVLCLCVPALSQNTPDEQLVKDVIAQLFKSMENGDSASMRKLFAKEVTMATAMRDKANNPVLRVQSDISGWLKAVGTPHEKVWYEEIWNVKVQLDGDFAQVWCDFAFYVGNNFSHCGIDAFHLHKGKDGWKIFHIADTHRKDNCEIPKAIQDKHK